MTPRSNIILWLIATVAVAALTALAVNRRELPQKPDSNASITDPPGLSLHEWMHQLLEITAAQHALLDPLETAYEKERLQARQQIRQLGRELAQAVRDSASAETILSTQEKLNAAQGQLQQATLKHFLEMKQHLTPAQAEKLAAWTHDSLLLQPTH